MYLCGNKGSWSIFRSWSEKFVLGTLTNLKRSNAQKDLSREIQHPILSFIRLSHLFVLVCTACLDSDYSATELFLFHANVLWKDCTRIKDALFLKMTYRGIPFKIRFLVVLVQISIKQCHDNIRNQIQICWVVTT